MMRGDGAASMPGFVNKTRVRFRDLDGMGHVNHAVYLTYLEEARIAFLTAAMGPLDPSRPFRFLVVRAEVDYKRPSLLGDVLTTTLRATRFGRTSFDFEYDVADAHGAPVAAARTVQVCIDENGRPTPVPDEFRKAVEGSLSTA